MKLGGVLEGDASARRSRRAAHPALRTGFAACLFCLASVPAGAQTVAMPDLFAGPAASARSGNALGELRGTLRDAGVQSDLRSASRSRPVLTGPSLITDGGLNDPAIPALPQNPPETPDDPATAEWAREPTEAPDLDVLGPLDEDAPNPFLPDRAGGPAAATSPTLLSTDRVMPVVRPATEAPGTGPLRGGLANPGGPLLANPPLSAGVAAETAGLTRALRTNEPLFVPSARPDEPFAPLGLRAGRFLLLPELVTTLGASSNLTGEAGGASGAFADAELSAILRSDFSRHEVEIGGAVGLRRNFSGDPEEEPRARLDARARLDLGALTALNLRGALNYRREDPIELDLPAGVRISSRPEVLDSSVAAELARDFGPIRLATTLTAARRAYDGTPEIITDPSKTTLTAGLRARYRLSPAIMPFIEGSLGRRLYDAAIPLPGEADISRNGLIPALRAGVELDLAEKLEGEIAVGAASFEADDARAATASAPTIDGRLVWSPQRGTDITLTGRTTLDAEGGADAVTASYEGGLALTHALGARADFFASLAAEYRRSSRSDSDDLLLAGELGFAYWFSRYAGAELRYGHREFVSDQSVRDYSSDTISLAMRFRR